MDGEVVDDGGQSWWRWFWYCYSSISNRRNPVSTTNSMLVVVTKLVVTIHTFTIIWRWILELNPHPISNVESRCLVDQVVSWIITNHSGPRTGGGGELTSP